MTRILHYGLSRNPGGIETYLKLTAEHIDRDRFHFDFLYTDMGGLPSGAERLQDLGSTFFGMTPRRDNPLRNHREVRTLLKSGRFDILHFHANSASYLTPVHVAIELGVPTLVHSHAAGSVGGRRTLAIHRANLLRTPWAQVHRAAVSASAGRWMFGNFSDFRVIRPGLDLNNLAFDDVARSEIRRTLRVDDDQFVIGTVGAFLPAKNHSFVVEVFAEVIRTGTDAVLVLVGGGPLEPEVRRQVRGLGLEHRVRFLGPRSDVGAVLSALDSFLFPSHAEGLGLAALEAQTSGLPCFLSQGVPASALVTRNARRLSSSTAPAAWADQVLSAGKNAHRASSIDEVRAEGWSAEEASALLEDEYERILESERPDWTPKWRPGPGRALQARPREVRQVGEPEVLWAALVTYNRPNECETMLEVLGRQTKNPDHVIVVDNGSQDAVRRIAESRKAVYLDPGENLGPAGGIATAMEYVLERASEHDWIVLLDDDDPPSTDDALARLWEFAQARLAADEHTAAVGNVGGFYDRRLGIFRRAEDEDLRGAVLVDVIGGGHLPLYRCAAMREVGIFDRSLFFGFEEGEFGLRLRSAGYALYVDSGPWMTHRNARGESGARSSRVRTPDSKAIWRRYYSLRNAILLAWRYGRPGTAFLVAAGGVWRGMGALTRTRRPRREFVILLASARDGLLKRSGRTLNPATSAK